MDDGYVVVAPEQVDSPLIEVEPNQPPSIPNNNNVDPIKTGEITKSPQVEKPAQEKAVAIVTPAPHPEYIVPIGSMGAFATTFVPSSQREITWKLPNFPELINLTAPSSKDKDEVKILFKMGDEIGLPSTWKIYLVKNGDDIGAFLSLHAVSPEWKNKEVYAKLVFKLLLADSARAFKTSTLDMRDYSLNKNYGWAGFFKLSDMIIKSNNLLSEKDEATFTANLTIYNKYAGVKTEGKAVDVVIPVVYNVDTEVINTESRKSMGQDFGVLLASGNYSDVVLQSGDGRSFKAHKSILSARSPVFAAMFESQMSEGRTGHVTIDDMSGAALDVLLRFIYTSEFDASMGKEDSVWQEICMEIINAAAKYSIPVLRDQCDHHLVDACVVSNAFPLLRLARLHGLKKAEAKLKDWIRLNVVETLDFIDGEL